MGAILVKSEINGSLKNIQSNSFPYNGNPLKETDSTVIHFTSAIHFVSFSCCLA